LNRGPADYESAALPTELPRRSCSGANSSRIENPTRAFFDGNREIGVPGDDGARSAFSIVNYSAANWVSNSFLAMRNYEVRRRGVAEPRFSFCAESQNPEESYRILVLPLDTGERPARQGHGRGRGFRYRAATTLRKMRRGARLTAGAGREDVSAASGMPRARLGKGNGARDSDEVSQGPSELVGK
jgi:hypothetical protein